MNPIITLLKPKIKKLINQYDAKYITVSVETTDTVITLNLQIRNEQKELTFEQKINV